MRRRYSRFRKSIRRGFSRSRRRGYRSRRGVSRPRRSIGYRM